jgi:hypothetical protein
MKKPELDAAGYFLRTFLGFGLFITLCSLGLLFVQPRDSAEFYISICNLLIGLALTLGVVLFVKFFR